MFDCRAAAGVFVRRAAVECSFVKLLWECSFIELKGCSSAELLECSSVKLPECSFVELLTVVPGQLRRDYLHDLTHENDLQEGFDNWQGSRFAFLGEDVMRLALHWA